MPINKPGAFSRAKTLVGSVVRRMFAFAGVTDSDNRQSIAKDLQSPDTKLDKKDRDKAVSRSRQHQEDFALAGWACRKHVDFVAEHRLSFKTKDRSLNRDLEAQFAELFTAKNFDIRGMHSMDSFSRLVEARSLVDGDIFVQRLRSGHVQAIESDRVRTPGKKQKGEWVHGCQKNKAGAITKVAVHSRGKTKNRFEFERSIDYSSVFHHGQFTGFDQTRGISPYIAVMNDSQDLVENKAYALARSKISQFFGLHIGRSDPDVDSDLPNPTKGPFILETDTDGVAKFLTDSNPSIPWQEFMQTVTAIALKGVDIPYSFWQENFTNFFGQKSALLLYLKSAFSKRRNHRERWRDPWVRWKLATILAKPESRYLRNLEVIPFRWIPLGTPWANPLQEVQASIQEIAMGLNSRQRKVQETLGEDFFEIIDELAEEEEYMTDKRVQIVHPSTLIMRDVQNVEAA